MSDTMTAAVCREKVYPRDDPHGYGVIPAPKPPHECGRPAKFEAVSRPEGRGTRVIYLCGTHVKWYKRFPNRWSVKGAQG